ncbi:MAG: hypothetical protein KDA52_19545 [Planctomycetaceae bacterium]|nr:hypothetical protein [Planctomycetaceae bacterium]
MSLTLDPDESRRRLDEIFALHEVGRDLMFAGAKRDHPEKTDEELWHIVAERLERRRRNKWGKLETDS